MGIVPDTSVLMYYVYGNTKQKKKIQKEFDSHENIIINPIILSEIGRVIYGSFFKLRKLINSYISINENLQIDDFWIDMTQKINKIRRNQLYKALMSIITYYRNEFAKFKIDRDDPYYVHKTRDRIESAIFKIIDELLDFQEIIQKWQVKDNFSCQQAEWEIVYNSDLNDYEFTQNVSCRKSNCSERENKLLKLIKKYETVFITILNEGNNISNIMKLTIDTKFIETIKKLINIREKKGNFNFTRKYCYHLGDFLISEILLNSNDILYTLNLNHFKFIFHFLGIDKKKILSFS